jgi:hypothetical protein
MHDLRSLSFTEVCALDVNGFGFLSSTLFATSSTLGVNLYAYPEFYLLGRIADKGHKIIKIPSSDCVLLKPNSLSINKQFLIKIINYVTQDTVLQVHFPDANHQPTICLNEQIICFGTPKHTQGIDLYNLQTKQRFSMPRNYTTKELHNCEDDVISVSTQKNSNVYGQTEFVVERWNVQDMSLSLVWAKTVPGLFTGSFVTERSILLSFYHTIMEMRFDGTIIRKTSFPHLAFKFACVDRFLIFCNVNDFEIYDKNGNRLKSFKNCPVEDIAVHPFGNAIVFKQNTKLRRVVLALTDMHEVQLTKDNLLSCVRKSHFSDVHLTSNRTIQQ